jgi:DNA-binding NarL/FixJ family response regulator
MDTIRVLIADDHTIFRQGLKALLEQQPDIRVVGEAATGPEAVDLAQKLEPTIIVMDITMPELNGLQASSRILSMNPEARIVILSMYDDAALIAQAVRAGVRGYLVKQTAASELIAALRAVYRGDVYFSPPVARVILKLKEEHADPVLTPRETEILQFVAQGISSREIGSILCISARTVEKHRQQIMDKLDRHDIASLTRYAITKGIAK